MESPLKSESSPFLVAVLLLEDPDPLNEDGVATDDLAGVLERSFVELSAAAVVVVAAVVELSAAAVAAVSLLEQPAKNKLMILINVIRWLIFFILPF